ncbi:TBC1 domain family member 25 [Lucilia cuprina]|nr:TBC1 domain family member 25 [Lucilia cuprina]
MSNSIFAHTREAVRVKVKKCEPNLPPEWRKFSVDPQITSLEVLYSLLAKAFDIKSDFSIKYKAYDPAGNEIYLAVLSDWDLDAAFLRIHNISIQTSTEPCLMLQIDIKPFTEVKEWDPDLASSPSATLIVSNSAGATPTGSTARELISPLQQSLGVSQKYVQQMQTKLPGLIMNQMEKTFSMVQKAFNLNEETMAALPPRPPLADNEFRMFLDALGQIQRCDELRKVIFFGGIDPSLRRVVWKHILNVYPSVMNGHQRMDYMRRKSEQYYKLRETWKAAIKQGYVVGELAYVTSMVKKDVLRTDRLHPFYAGSDDNQNIAALFNILTTYALNHPSVSYCQGMSDIASPLLVTMNDEAQAYICFCAIMSRVRGNFMLDGIAMTQKFAHLTEALSFYDAEFWEYLKAQQADDLLFCYRWLLLELKREFPFEDALRMLEVQWSSLKYETSVAGDREELKLYEKEFVPTTETPVSAAVVGGIPTPASIGCGNGTSPISPSFLMAKPRENAYTKVCALRRQSSSASLNSLSSSLSTSTNHLGCMNVLNSKLDVTKRLNQSLDDNITRHATRRQRRASSKAHQSLDETKMLQLLEGSVENSVGSMKNERSNIDDDDDVFSDTNHFNFHDTNPFKDNDEDQLSNASQVKQIPKAFLSSSSSSLHGDDTISSTTTGCGNVSGNSGDADASVDSSSECNSPDNKNLQMPKGIAKLQNKNILSNYNSVSNIIAKQLATNVSEGVKRVSSTGGGHFRDLKEKIAATSRKGLSLEECNEKSQQKLVKNFNEFLNFASLNKSRVANAEKISATILTTGDKSTTAHKSKTPSPTHNPTSPTQTLHPLVQLTKSGFTSSLDSDSSSIPDTTNNTWSCSTAATAIQQANNLSSNSLQLELNSQLSSLTHTPERTPIAERQRDQSTPNSASKHKDQGDSSATPDDSQELDYYPMTTAITRELRLEAENLDRQLFGDLICIKDDEDGKKDSTGSEIEYEKLGKDSLDMVEDLKENEIITCPEVSELMMRRRQRDKSLAAKNDDKVSKHLLNGRIDSNLNVRDGGGIEPEEQTKSNVSNVLKLNPFLDESLLRDEILSTAQKTGSISSSNNIYNLPTTSTSLPEVLVPISTDTPDATAIDEMATTAAEDEVTFSTKSPPFSSSATNNSSPTPRLPPPSEFGGGNPFLMFLCLTLLLQHRNTIMKSNMDYNEIAMHFDKMVRKHDVTRVLNQARRMYIDYLKNQTTYNPQQKQEQQSTIPGSVQQQQPTSDVNRNATASTSNHQKHSKNIHHNPHHNSSVTTSSTSTSPSFFTKSS